MAELQSEGHSFSSFTHFYEDLSQKKTEPNVKYMISNDAPSVEKMMSVNLSPLLAIAELAPQAGGVPAISGNVLNYPNPFRLATGTEIGYHLNINSEIEIQLYNMRGQRIWKKYYESGKTGGTSGYNIVPFTSADVGHFPLSSAIYFYVILAEGKVLGKGKMAILP